MKLIFLYQLLKVSPVVLWLLIFSSCTQEVAVKKDIPSINIPEGQSVLKVTLQSTVTKSYVSTLTGSDIESQVDSIKLFLFDADQSDLLVNVYSLEVENSNEYTVLITEKSNNMNVVALANPIDSLVRYDWTPYIGVINFSEFSEMTTKHVESMPTPLFLMAAIQNGGPFAIKGNDEISIAFDLIRFVARIDILNRDSVGINHVFNLQEARLINIPSSSYLYASGTPKNSKNLRELPFVSIAPSDGSTGKMYSQLYAYPKQSISKSEDEVQLEITGLYNGIPANYIVPFGDRLLQANHRYIVVLDSITQTTVSATIEVVDWSTDTIKFDLDKEQKVPEVFFLVDESTGRKKYFPSVSGKIDTIRFTKESDSVNFFVKSTVAEAVFSTIATGWITIEKTEKLVYEGSGFYRLFGIGVSKNETNKVRRELIHFVNPISPTDRWTICFIQNTSNSTDPEQETPSVINAIYVSPLGNDDASGTEFSPYKTIQKALDTAQPGDIIYLRNGLYNEKVEMTTSGTAQSNILIQAYPNETPVLDGTGLFNGDAVYPDYAVFRLNNVHHVKIEGLTIQNTKSAGIYGKNGTSNIVIEKCTIMDCVAPAISFGADFIATSDIKVLYNYVSNCAQLSREAISLRTVENFEIAHNHLVNVKKESIDAKSGCKNGDIHNNLLENSGSVGIYLDAGYADNPMNDGQYNINVYQNKIVNPENIGICIASEAGNLGSNLHVYNNLIYDFKTNPGSGIKVADHESNGPLKDIYIYNNTVYGRGQQGIYVNTHLVENIMIYNNISMNNLMQVKIKEGVGIPFNQIIIKNNLHYGSTANDDLGTDAIIADPLFVDIMNGNFNLKPTSPAINKGVEEGSPTFDFRGVSRPQGGLVDIGAYEYQP